MITRTRPTPGSHQTVAVVGAAGHTGRFVVAELLRRGLAPVAIVRDGSKLPAQGGWDDVEVRSAATDQPASLRDALSGVAAVINCAGPFLDTAEPVAAAAVSAGVHYLDVTAEQASATATLDRFDAAAREAGVLVLPAMGFYGGLSDLLATAVAGEWDEVDEISVAIALDSWRPTLGTRLTGARNTYPRLIVDGGRLVQTPQPPAETAWQFAQPFGRQEVIGVPFSEVVLLARHLRAGAIRTWLNRAPLADLRDSATPGPQAVDERGRSAQVFQVEAVVRKDGHTRRGRASGRDIYAVTAPFVCEAVERILSGEARTSGARPPGAVFAARSYLEALAPDLDCTLPVAEPIALV
jgi:NAD(P)-dependent dehydrogenase (short-subunit alcohol dehydrogenase family)